jgi:hypothetical protein
MYKNQGKFTMVVYKKQGCFLVNMYKNQGQFVWAARKTGFFEVSL